MKANCKKGKGGCSLCGQEGHIKAICPHNKNGNEAANSSGRANSSANSNANTGNIPGSMQPLQPSGNINTGNHGTEGGSTRSTISPPCPSQLKTCPLFLIQPLARCNTNEPTSAHNLGADTLILEEPKVVPGKSASPKEFNKTSGTKLQTICNWELFGYTDEDSPTSLDLNQENAHSSTSSKPKPKQSKMHTKMALKLKLNKWI